MNIKITKSSYKTKENKRAIIYDCSAKNYRKKINTGVFVEEELFENNEAPTPISLNITLEKLRNKKKDALIKYYENNWSTDDFRWLTMRLCALADGLCNGRVVSTLEGGYDLDALAEACAAHVQVLIDSAMS